MITPSGKPVTVAIADDHTLIRSALVSLIVSGNSHYKVCIQAENGKELLEELDRVGLTDIILLDISMPVMDGFETMIMLKKKYRHPNVIAITVHYHQEAILKMSLLGVKGYVLKTQAAEDLFCTLDAVAVNEPYFSEAINEKLHLASASNLHRGIASLKERERTFLKHLCTGMTYKEVAAAMNISPYTVEDYRDALFKKFEIKSKTELVLFALKYKIVEQKR